MSRKTYRTLAVGALIVGIGRMFRFHARRMACGTGAQEGGRVKHWRRPDGSRHPWFAHHGKWAAEKADETEAAAEGEAAAESGPAEVLI